MTVKGEKPLFYGSRCEKYDVDRTRQRRDDLPDLFAEREEALMGSYMEEKPLAQDAPTIGIPRLLHFHELMPFWRTFFSSLGFRIVFSERTNKRLIHKGIEKIVAETCFPIKVAHGHLLDLIDKGVDTIFLPSVINMPLSHPSLDRSFACPYVQSFPDAVKSAIDYPELIRKLVPVSCPCKKMGWNRENREGMAQMGAAAAEQMKQTPMYQLYAQIAPRVEDWPVLLTKLGDLLRQDYDWSEGVAAIKAPTLLVAGDADAVLPAHMVEFFELLGGGKRDGGWDGSGLIHSRLAILPAMTHYVIFDSPLLAPIVIPFLDAPMP